MAGEEIIQGVYLIGGSGYSHSQDAAIYLIACEEELVMIDAGAGKGTRKIEENIRDLGLDPNDISALILTHCHVDHIGSALNFRETFGCTIIAHDLDAHAIEIGDPYLTAAHWYGTRLPQTPVDRRLTQEHETLSLGSDTIHFLHTPGHTPGSIVVYLDRAGKRVLFGQDIHGPFSREFNSDIGQWRTSMERLLRLEADILCEGHFGTYEPKAEVERYIRGYLDQYAGEYP
ncbi:MAG: MBL fold metallo-hydrolase [Desulfomonilia bacterium]|nr:MBL fold metallo-hydrolase [Desulfomonilia bacterium]